MSPTKEQLLLLKNLLLEFYTYKLEELTSKDYFTVYKNQSYINHTKERINNPLNVGTERFHENRVELLDIEEGYPLAHRNNEGKVIAIQLRPITDDQKVMRKTLSWSDIAKKNISLPRKLLIGCGNNPTTICYHYPYSRREYTDACREYFSDDIVSANIIMEQTEREWEKGRNYLHNEYITIDLEVSMNPTIIAEFSEDKLDFLPENYFEVITQEGLCLPENCKIEMDRIGVTNYVSSHM